MADQKISELTAATSAASADLIPIVQGGSNKKLTVANFLANLNSPVVINSTGSDQDTRILGNNDDDLFFVNAGDDKIGIGTQTPTEKLDVDGNIAYTGFMRAVGTPQIIQGQGAQIISLTSAVTLIHPEGSTQYVLADGVAGQIKTIICRQHAGGPAVLLPTTPGTNYATITFTATGSSATLQFVGSKWWIVSAYGVTVSL